MSTFYESDRAVSEYLLFHYGKAEEILPYPDGPVSALNYPIRCVMRFSDDIGYSPKMRVLDLGCAVGRSTFEFARHCGEVVGIDYSNRFIDCANQLRDEGAVSYRYVEQGELTREAVARVPDEIDRDRVRFEQGDAMFLREGLGRFDVILLANLIDRLVDPAKCLASLVDLVKPGGFTVITSPYTWLEEFTPREHWVGAKVSPAGEMTTFGALGQLMNPRFELRGSADLPFLIREHARKFQWSVAQGTLWCRRD